MKNKNFEYKMTLDGRDIGGSVSGPQADAAAVVSHLQGIYPKATNVTATELVATVAPPSAPPKPSPAPFVPPKPAAAPAPIPDDAKPKG